MDLCDCPSRLKIGHTLARTELHGEMKTFSLCQSSIWLEPEKVNGICLDSTGMRLLSRLGQCNLKQFENAQLGLPHSNHKSTHLTFPVELAWSFVGLAQSIAHVVLFNSITLWYSFWGSRMPVTKPFGIGDSTKPACISRMCRSPANG